MSRKIYIFLALTLFPSALLSQEVITDIPDSAIIIRNYLINPITKRADSTTFDTTMQEFSAYNFIYKKNFSVSFLGNNGNAYQSNDFLERIAYSPFIFDKNYTAYLHSPYSILHFNTRKPFTRIEYITFGRRDINEQSFEAFHTQNFSQYTNFGVRYNLIASRGIYLNQGTKSNRFSLFGSYNKEPYSIYGSISVNSMKQNENGGLVDIKQFEIHDAPDAIAYRMHIDTGASKMRQNILFLTQNLDIQKKTSETDSLKKKTEKSLFHLNHTLIFSRYLKSYIDNIGNPAELNFYKNNYYLINEARDSAFTYILENSFQISGDKFKFLPGFIAGAKHQYQTFGYRYPAPAQVIINEIPVDTIVAANTSSHYNNIAIFASILDEEMKRFKYNGSVEYYLTGYRKGDFKADFILRYASRNQKAQIIAGANLYLYEPDFFLKNYSSSHFKWNNDFFKISNSGAKIAFRGNNNMFSAEARLNVFGNLVYLDTLALPAVSTENILLLSFQLEKRFKWKGFNQVNKFLFQKSTTEDIIKLPILAYWNTSYYEHAFFNKVLRIQLGFDFCYHTSYYADAFMPATGMFYRQDKDQVGNFPFLDAFLNWKLKRTRLFLKYTNSLAGLAGYRYFTTYGYPMNESGLRFGFSWTFYD